MAHILLTDHCNRRCPYCFAKERLADEQHTNMAYDDFVTAVEFLVRSDEPGITLLGGEPTLHPDFVRLYRYLIRRRLNVLMFTNGCAETQVVQELRHPCGTATVRSNMESWKILPTKKFINLSYEACVADMTGVSGNA